MLLTALEIEHLIRVGAELGLSELCLSDTRAVYGAKPMPTVAALRARVDEALAPAAPTFDPGASELSQWFSAPLEVEEE